MTLTYLVRHGQTAWNQKETFRGRIDIALNEKGLMEAELAAEYFRQRKVDAIYTSPLSRAVQTAEKIAGALGLSALVHTGIIDMSFGDWEGRRIDEVERDDALRFRLWQDEPHLLNVPGGETLEEVRTRAMAALEDVTRRHAHRTVILVSHRAVTKVLICAILGLDNSHFWQIDQDTAAINLLRHEHGKYALALMNETCHLKPLADAGTR